MLKDSREIKNKTCAYYDSFITYYNLISYIIQWGVSSNVGICKAHDTLL